VGDRLLCGQVKDEKKRTREGGGGLPLQLYSLGWNAFLGVNLEFAGKKRVRSTFLWDERRGEKKGGAWVIEMGDLERDDTCSLTKRKKKKKKRWGGVKEGILGSGCIIRKRVLKPVALDVGKIFIAKAGRGGRVVRGGKNGTV